MAELGFDAILGHVKAAPVPRTLTFAPPAAPEAGADAEADAFAGLLPLADDFFAEVGGYTAAEEAEILELMKEGYGKALKLANSPYEESGLALMKDSHGVEIVQGKPLDPRSPLSRRSPALCSWPFEAAPPESPRARSERVGCWRLQP